jgi:hypothetical protein
MIVQSGPRLTDAQVSMVKDAVRSLDAEKRACLVQRLVGLLRFIKLNDDRAFEAALRMALTGLMQERSGVN